MDAATRTQHALHALRTEALALEVEDVLALCFAFSKDAGRLSVYLDVLRQKQGVKSQGAACLICFDLARRGDARFEGEFLSLVPVVRAWMEPEMSGLTKLLLGDSSYLQELWEDLALRLRGMDPRTADAPPVVLEDTDVFEMALLTNEELEELGDLEILDAGDELRHAQWKTAMERFSGSQGDHDPVMEPTDGFFADDADDISRLDRFRSDALSLEADVPDAASMLAIMDLFTAAHTRSRNLFGRRNKARDLGLRSGLVRFCRLKMPPGEAAAWLSQPTAVEFAWEKVAEHILDFLAFASTQPRATAETESTWVETTVDAYLASSRPQPPPAILAESTYQRRRR